MKKFISISILAVALLFGGVSADAKTTKKSAKKKSTVSQPTKKNINPVGSYEVVDNRGIKWRIDVSEDGSALVMTQGAHDNIGSWGDWTLYNGDAVIQCNSVPAIDFPNSGVAALNLRLDLSNGYVYADDPYGDKKKAGKASDRLKLKRLE